MKLTFKEIFFTLLILFLLLVGFNYYTSPESTPQIVTRLVYPVLRFEQAVRSYMQEWTLFWRSRSDITKELETCQREKQDLLARLSQIETTSDIDKHTRDLVDFAQGYQMEKGILSQVLVRHCDPVAHFFYVDAGENKQIEKDMVAVHKNCLLGRVSDVYPTYSKVVLITDKTCKVAACCPRTHVQGIAEGTNSLNEIKLTFVNHMETVDEHDLIVSSGEGLIFPRGFLIGRIKTYELDGFHYAISAEPVIEFDKLEYCYLIKKGTHVTCVPLLKNNNNEN